MFEEHVVHQGARPEWKSQSDRVVSHRVVTEWSQSSHLKGGHSCSFVLGAHVLLEEGQGHSMRPQVGIDQLDVHPELAEHYGLSQPLAGTPSTLHRSTGIQRLFSQVPSEGQLELIRI